MNGANAAQSPTWDGATPSIAALVSTFRRPHFLPELLATLEAQDLPHDEFEVVIVDNGSGDDTWAVLGELVSRSPLRVRAVQVPENHGPARGRNTGAAEVRAPIMAITDDDCLPTPGWLRGIRDVFADAAIDVVQGAVDAEPAHSAELGPWDHSKWISAPTPFFETCNVGYRRDAFERVGGFDEDDPLLHPASGRAFGEDACLAWAVRDGGGATAFAPDALVYHRCIPGTYRRWLSDQALVIGFPELARRSDLVRRWLWKGRFLDKRTASFDLAAVGVIASLAALSPLPAVAGLPYLWRRWRDARRWSPADRAAAAGIFARLAVGDALIAARLVQGSVRYRHLVL